MANENINIQPTPDQRNLDDIIEYNVLLDL